MSRTRVGTAEVDLRLLTGHFSQGVQQVRRGVDGLRDRFRSMRAELNTAQGQMRALGAIAGAGFAAKRVLELGAAVEETGSKFRTVFGPAADDVQKFIDQFGTMAGLTDRAAQDVLATTGAIVQGMGFAGNASAAFAVEVTKLAGDLSSFNNIPIEETSRAIQAALTGEREQLKRLGIVLREADVQQRALANSGKAAAGALTDQDKALASLQLIAERAGVAVGDLARTQESAANRARELEATLGNIQDRIASALLPVISFLVDRFQSLIQWIEAAGARAALFGAEIDLLLARMKFWDKDGIRVATENLGFMRQAFEEVLDEIAGFNTDAGGLSDTTRNMQTLADVASGSGPASVAGAMQDVGAKITDVNVAAIQANIISETLAVRFNQAAIAAGAWADEQERLNNSMSQFRAVTGALGFLTRFGPLAALAGPLGTVVGGVSAGSALLSAFSGGGGGGGQQQTASAAGGIANDVTLTLNVTDFSGRTTRVLRGRINDLNNLDVPVVI